MHFQKCVSCSGQDDSHGSQCTFIERDSAAATDVLSKLLNGVITVNKVKHSKLVFPPQSFAEILFTLHFYPALNTDSSKTNDGLGFFLFAKLKFRKLITCTVMCNVNLTITAS